MKTSLRPFLSHIVDYAGLYPPSELPLQEAFRKYLSHIEQKEAWMLSKFVVGTGLLRDLITLIDAEPESPSPFKITLVGAASNDLDSFKKVIDNTVSAIKNALASTEKKIRVSTLEIKVPLACLKEENSSDLQAAIKYAVQSMAKSETLPYQIFFEVPGFEFDIDNAKVLIKGIHTHNEWLESNEKENYCFSGFKIRCGGVEAFQFPPSDYLAEAITFSRENAVPLKFTAGLHHPVRHFNDSVQTKMHGFLNVFGASLLSYSKKLSATELLEILNDENASNFSFDETEFSWKGQSVSFEELHMLRDLSVTSFGSCSFDEPVEDLQKLNLIA
ncbi:MAG: hypothetical protein RIE52_00535 [Balneola sp.]